MRLLMLLPFFVLSTLVQAAGGGSVPSGGSAPQVKKTPQQRAASFYNAGLKNKKKAWKYEKKLADISSEKKRIKTQKKIAAQYKKAQKNQANAIALVNNFYQAFSELGYSYRKLGDYDKSIRAYNVALSIKSDYSEAIEYRGEAYLARGAYEESRQAYMTLFRDDPEKANMLMQAFETWSVTDTPAGTEAEAFKSWILERKQLLSVSQNLSTNNSRDWQ